MKRSTRLTHVRQLALGAGLLGVGLLTGCGVALSTPASGTDYNPPPQVTGQVNLGKNNLAYSKITIYQTVNTGTAGADGRYTGTAKVLGTTTTDFGGTWEMPADVKCSSPDMLYVVAAEGTPFMGFETFTNEPNNEDILLMTAVGDCSILDNTKTIFTNEATTVAAVNALAPFISVSGQTVNVVSSSTNYAGVNGVGTTTSAAGLKHAFQAANSLASYDHGFFETTTGGLDLPTTGFNNMPLLHTLAYMQYLADVGSDNGGGDYEYRKTLLDLTKPDGGTAPATTLEAMLNIAQWKYPLANIGDLYLLSQHRMPHTSDDSDPIDRHPPYNRTPYWPLLTTGTNLADFSVSIRYRKDYGATTTGQGLSYPVYIALDANDNVYAANDIGSTSYQGNVIAMDNAGKLLWTSDNDLDSFTSPRAIAVDSQNHVFAVSNLATSPAVPEISEFDATSGQLIQKIPTGMTNAVGLAIDAHDNLWVTSGTASTSATGPVLQEFLNAGSNVYTPTAIPGAFAALGQVQIDQNQNVWVASTSSSASGNFMYLLPNTGTAGAPAYASPVQSIAIPGTTLYGVAIDQTGAAYSSTAGSGSGVYLTTVTGTGASATLSTSNIATSDIASPRQAQTDGIGSYWTVDTASNKPLFRYVSGTDAAQAYLPCYAEFESGTNPVVTQPAVDDAKKQIGCAKTNNAATEVNLANKFDIAIDSTGSVWTTSADDSTSGDVVRILGIAAPSWPLKASAKHGVMP